MSCLFCSNCRELTSRVVLPSISYLLIGYYVPSQRVWFLHLFEGLKSGIDFTHFSLESGVVFEGTTGVYERIYRFNFKYSKKREGRENEMYFLLLLLNPCAGSLS